MAISTRLPVGNSNRDVFSTSFNDYPLVAGDAIKHARANRETLAALCFRHRVRRALLVKSSHELRAAVVNALQ
jgi:hypothetical protein